MEVDGSERDKLINRSSVAVRMVLREGGREGGGGREEGREGRGGREGRKERGRGREKGGRELGLETVEKLT